MKHFSLLFILLAFINQSFAQLDTNNIPIGRQSRHDDIKNEINACDKMDGKLDGTLHLGFNDKVNAECTKALFTTPNELRYWIETNEKLLPTPNDKIRYLKYVASLLQNVRKLRKDVGMYADDFPVLMQTFDKILKAKVLGQSMLPYLEKSNYAISKILLQGFADDSEYVDGSAIVYLKYANLHSDKILQTIAPYTTQPYADSLITVACKLNPVQFYSYSQNINSPVGRLIHRSTNKMVQQVALLSKTDNALFYFPFLDDLLSGKQNIADIKKIVGDGIVGYDSIKYFKLLVQTAIDYSKRIVLKDTPVAYTGPNGLLSTLHNKAIEHFITPINVLHEVSNPAIRFKAIQPLAPIDLYYMMVTGENDIYTSSYKNSFIRMLQLMGTKPRGDSLLLAVNFDKFRKFIKMAANYNKLDTFLKTMPAIRAEMVMKAFVANLDNNNLEDAVDVADSYSSITNKMLQESILQNVSTNEELAITSNNTKAKVIYSLLKTIFLSANDSSIDVAKLIGIPPIYDVAKNYMQDDKGRIIEQVFFYGDKDGKTFFIPFRNSFNPNEWKVTDKKEWIEAASLKGNITVYANKPLDNDANLDDTAQIHLIKYMEAMGMKPSVIVHRGHSYWLERTMSRMPGDAKIVLLGSCGGYQNLNKILEINPEAHIISTKEIGTGDINTPILNYINATFKTGNNLPWRKMWQSLTKSFSTDPSRAVRESWENYIPPYKNLGAIFLKAYTKKMEEE